MTTAAALIIGEEILGGRCADANGPWLLGFLRARGVRARHVAYVPDVLDDIAEAVARLAPQHDWLLSSGGVGPTHDDITFEGVARGLGLPLERRAELVAVLERRLRSPVNEAALRMADVPRGAELWWDGEIAYPVVTVRNVIVLPGLPSLFRAKLEAVGHRLRGRLPGTASLFSTAYETAFADLLRRATERFPAVKIGSYPRTSKELPWRAEIVLESDDRDSLEACRAWLQDRLPEPWRPS